MIFNRFKKFWALGNCNTSDGLVSVRFGELKPSFLDQVRKDVSKLIVAESASEVGDKMHVTNWTKPIGQAKQFSLFNRSNDFNDFSSDHDGTGKCKSTDHLILFPALKSLIDSFPGKLNCRLNCMGADGGGLSPHEEHIFMNSRWLNVSSKLRIRIHIVLFTNDSAYMFLRKERYHYGLGGVYGFNNGAVHSAVNRGSSDRYHIVMDLELTDEVYKNLTESNNFVQHFFEVCKPNGEFDWKVFQSYGGLDSICKKIGVRNEKLLCTIHSGANALRALLVRSGIISL